jgi:hypothetical protein
LRRKEKRLEEARTKWRDVIAGSSPSHEEKIARQSHGLLCGARTTKELANSTREVHG